MDNKKRIFSIHSQKGGVGKTSISIALAGFEKQKYQRKVIIIDADFTGTSMGDIWPSQSKYINDIILAPPNLLTEYLSRDGLRGFTREIDGIDYLPSSPIRDDIMKMVPLISQEDHLHFFRYRLDMLLNCLFSECLYDTVIIDLSPGLFGISKTVIDFESNSDVQVCKFMVTTAEPNDYCALITSYSAIIDERNSIKCQRHKNRNVNDLSRLIINKAVLKEPRAKFDPVNILKEIRSEIVSRSKVDHDGNYVFKDKRRISEETMDMLIDSSKIAGALAAEFKPRFRVYDIIPAIANMVEKQNNPEAQAGPSLHRIGDWIETIGRIIEELNVQNGRVTNV